MNNEPSYTEQPPGSAELLAKAVALHREGNLDMAEMLGQHLLVSSPENVPLLKLLGLINLQRGNLEKALRFYDKLIALGSTDMDVYHGHAAVLYSLQRHDEALIACEKALACNPDNAEVYNTRATILRSQEKYEEALEDSRKAVALNPDFAVGYNALGITQTALRQFDDAIVSLTKAIAMNPDFAPAYSNRGKAYQGVGKYDAALTDYGHAIALNPYYADAYWNKSLIRLLQGEYEEGWKLYEWRWKRSQIDKKEIRTFKKPLWSGKESLAGKTVLIHSEQGLGDCIQFCRYIPMIEALGARIIMEVHSAALMKLFSAAFTNARIILRGNQLPEYDFYCPLMSLPLAFGTNATSIPAPIPYLYASPDRNKFWQDRLGKKSKPRIGLVWSGATQNKSGHYRSMPLSLLAAGLDYKRYDFFALQTEIREGDKTVLASSRILSLAAELKDFMDTASVISEMDLVITIDTSVAHLAGALGKPTWVLLAFAPDFRWLLNRENSPWYPTAKLFRQQKPDDWESVIKKIKEELDADFIH